MILIEYRIDPIQVPAFVQAMRPLKAVRKRDGALNWYLFEDAAEPGLVVESFVVPSWLEHLRQHERITRDDHLTQAQIQRFHIGDQPPRVRHLIAPST